MAALRASVAVGVFAYNEEASLRNAVAALLDQPLGVVGGGLQAELASVVIVSCGSTDRTNQIGAELAAADPRVHLLVRPRREGKAAAINAFLGATRADLVVLIGADVVLAHGGLRALLRPFADPGVGMTGGRPVPQNARQGVGMLVHTLWAMHDRIARRTPKLGEAIAVRGPVGALPEWTCADEAYIESEVTRKRALRLAYCPDAIVHNRGPETFADYLELRRRIARAHSEITASGYRPATRRIGAVLRHALAHAVDHPRHIGWLGLAGLVEGFAWMAGYLESRGARPTRGLWSPIGSAKREVSRPLPRVATSVRSSPAPSPAACAAQ